MAKGFLLPLVLFAISMQFNNNSVYIVVASPQVSNDLGNNLLLSSNNPSARRHRLFRQSKLMRTQKKYTAVTPEAAAYKRTDGINSDSDRSGEVGGSKDDGQHFSNDSSDGQGNIELEIQKLLGEIAMENATKTSDGDEMDSAQEEDGASEESEDVGSLNFNNDGNETLPVGGETTGTSHDEDGEDNHDSSSENLIQSEGQDEDQDKDPDCEEVAPILHRVLERHQHHNATSGKGAKGVKSAKSSKTKSAKANSSQTKSSKAKSAKSETVDLEATKAQVKCTPKPTRKPAGATPNVTTSSPTKNPVPPPTTSSPTDMPSVSPVTPSPSNPPSASPVTSSPTNLPSASPITSSPSDLPSTSPVTSSPTDLPSTSPVTSSPTDLPSTSPVTSSPTDLPSTSPVTSSPTNSPTPSPVEDEPACGPFSPNPDDFEEGTFPSPPWSTGGAGDWALATDKAFGGSTTSIKSPNLEVEGRPNVMSNATLTLCDDFPGGLLRAQVIASVVPPRDVFIVYVDGESHTQVVNVNDWAPRVEIGLEPGPHRVDFSYQYNTFGVDPLAESPATREGAVWIDNVEIETTATDSSLRD